MFDELVLYLGQIAKNGPDLLRHFLALCSIPLIVLILFGYGRLVAKLNHSSSVDWAQQSVYGLALLITLGGLLNLFGLVSVMTAVACLLGGIFLGVAELWRHRNILATPKWRICFSPSALILGAIAIFICSVLILGNLFYPDYNVHDDPQAYIAFSVKMLSTGSLGSEPFSERRIETSLGGLYFLHALVLSIGDYPYLHILDPVVAYILLWGLLNSYLARQSVSSKGRLLAVLFSALYPPAIVNTTAVVIFLPMLVAVCRILEDVHCATSGTWRRGVVIGLLGASIATLKATILPLLGSVLAIGYGLRLLCRPRSGTFLWESIVGACVLLACLAPWMIANYYSVGSLLYPVLGSGGHGTQYRTYFDHAIVPLKDMAAIYAEDGLLAPPILFVFILAAISTVRHQWQSGVRARMLFGILLPSVLIADLGMVIGLSGEGLVRYAYPAHAVLAIFGVCHLIAVLQADKKERRVASMASSSLAVLTACAVVVANWYYIERMVAFIFRNAAIALVGPDLRPKSLYSLLRKGELHKVRAMQAAIEPGVPIMSRIDLAFLMDFRRNPILINDQPYGASPPPGMPVFDGPEKLAEYLLAKGVRYVAYSYANEAHYSAEDLKARMRTPWVLALTNNTVAFQQHLASLMKTRRLVFDDGSRTIIDLATLRPT